MPNISPRNYSSTTAPAGGVQPGSGDTYAYSIAVTYGYPDSFPYPDSGSVTYSGAVTYYDAWGNPYTIIKPYSEPNPNQ